MVENIVRVSVHAADRMFERFGCETWDRKQNIADRAWRNGKTYQDYSGKVSKFLYDIQTRHSEADHIAKNYDGKIFIFSSSGVLCTAFDESDQFKKLKKRLPVYRENRNFELDEYDPYDKYDVA